MAQRSRAQRLNGLFPLSYTGVVPVSPVNFVMDNRAPTINDSKNFYIGDLWLDTSTQPPVASDLWMLVSLVQNNATWVNFGAGNLESLTGNNTGVPVFPDPSDNINVIGDGTTINVVGNPGTNTLTISAVGTGLLQTLTGNSGTAHPVAGNINIVTANATPIFVGSGSTLTLDFDLDNLLLGSNAVSLAGTNNVGYGRNAGEALASGSYNTFIGSFSGFQYTTGNNSTGVGAFTLSGGLASSSGNTALGSQALQSVATGDFNLGLGFNAGGNYTGNESNNIAIANDGVIGDSGVIRIGTNGDQTTAYMAGVAGVSVSNQLPVVIDSVTGQLGTGAGTPSPMVGFGAYKSVDTVNATGDGTFFQVICDGVIYDLSSNYNGATGTFTAPTDGTYHFDTYIAANNITTQNLGSIFLVTTARTFETDLQSPVNDKQADNILHYQMSVDTLMSAGDTAYLQISLSGAAKTVGITGSIPPGSPIATYFNGHRLDPAASFITGTETFHTDDGNDVTPDINGLVNVTGAQGITTTGTVGPNTITIHPPASNVIFSVDLNSESNITGDGTTAQVGATAAASLNYDVGGNVNLGGGGTPVTFTAPATGYYQFNLELGVVITNVTGGTEFSGNFISTSGFNSNWGSLPTRNRVANFFASNAAIGIAASALIKMSAADTLIITYVSVGGAKVDGLFGGRLTGYRVA